MNLHGFTAYFLSLIHLKSQNHLLTLIINGTHIITSRRAKIQPTKKYVTITAAANNIQNVVFMKYISCLCIKMLALADKRIDKAKRFIQ
jgi:hypothetical protein